MSFMKELEDAFKKSEDNKKKIKKNPTIIYPAKKVSLIDKIKGIKGAFKRMKEKAQKDGIKALWVDEGEVVERQVCCSTCTDGPMCPYCGCQLKKSWFFPLGKSELKTEGCPNPVTYPHIRRYPPKNYWEVCLEKTSILMVPRNEKLINKSINNLIENATGKIEILVGLPVKSNFTYSPSNTMEEKINIQIFKNDNGRRVLLNEMAKNVDGKYLFVIDEDCEIDEGYDTKLKCVCEENIVVSCCIVENSLDGEKRFGKYIDKNFNCDWQINTKKDKWKKVEEIMVSPSIAYMIQKDTFWEAGGMETALGKSLNEDIEWSLNMWLKKGKVLVRTDALCAYPFENEIFNNDNDDIEQSKEILGHKWNENSEEMISLINKFSY